MVLLAVSAGSEKVLEELEDPCRAEIGTITSAGELVSSTV